MMKTINKKNVLKLAATVLLFCFAIGAANSQILEHYENEDETVLQTVNKPFRLYVWPDAVFSPNYVSGTNANINPLSRWTWTIDGTATVVKPATNDNWVEINPSALGTTTYRVIETFDAFVCADAGTTRAVQVIDVPYVRFDMTDGGSYMGLDNVLASGCGDVETAISVLFANAAETFPYNINLNYDVFNATLDGSGNIALGAPVVAPGVNYTYAEDSPLVITNTQLLGSETYGLEGGAMTVYRFTLAGWNARISRKSDYLEIIDDGARQLDQPGSYTYYSDPNDAGDVLTAYVVVLPQPITGPIYHIPNDFNEL